MRSVSVIIPAYNAEKFLRDAIQSVIAQNYPSLELIVVDDGSTDGTADVIKEFPQVEYVHQQNQGTAAALNTAVQLARGDLFAFLDSDDLWLPKKLEKQVDILSHNEHVGMVFSQIQDFLCDSMTREQKEKIEFNDKVMTGIQKSTLVIRRESFFSIGLFSSTSNIDMLDWYARAKEKKIEEYVIPEVLVRRRIHGNNQTLQKKKMKNEFPGVLKTILDRRRAQQ
jgi:glycosyltransferase involved in cell wall biosynthesis